MSAATMPPERARLLDTLRDYLEQLRQEGLEGVPVASSDGAAAITKRVTAGVFQDAPATRPEASMTHPREVTQQSLRALDDSLRETTSVGETPPYRYPGLERTLDLAALREFIGNCERCKLAPFRTNLVFGIGNPEAELMFVGEAPGAEEDLQGEPFVGRAGQLLTDIIERGMGMSRGEVYICNVVKCRPPENRNPEFDEVAACEPFLFRQIDLVRPRVIVGLGTFAVQTLLKVKTPISKLRGNWHEVRGVKLMPTFHPAYLLRNPAEKRKVWLDIQEVMKELGRTIPQRGTSR
ncbi:MAG: uracil-DNA glycosylase [Candidatus Binataceae bacterium]